MRIFMYLRAATDDGDAFTQQELECREYCKQHGITVAGVFKEIGSGLHWHNRNVFLDMRKRYLGGEAEGVVIRDYARLTRNPDHLLALIQEITEYHMTLICVQGSGDNPLLALPMISTIQIVIRKDFQS